MLKNVIVFSVSLILVLAVADWILNQWQNGGIPARKFFLVFVMASVMTSGILFIKRAEFVEEVSR